MKRSKYTEELRAIENLIPGFGYRFNIPHPWGLATMLYRSSRVKRLGLSVHVGVEKVVVYKKPIIKEWRS